MSGNVGQPKSDGQRLFELQGEYKAGRADALGEMYEMLATIAHKTINRIGQNDARGAALACPEREQKAHDAATYIIEQYLKRPGFLITDSITGYLYRRVLKELNYARKCDKMLVYTGELPERPKDGRRYEYIVTDGATGQRTSYCCVGELYMNPAFKGLRKKRLAECISTGKKWKNYSFDVLEIAE